MLHATSRGNRSACRRYQLFIPHMCKKACVHRLNKSAGRPRSDVGRLGGAACKCCAVKRWENKKPMMQAGPPHGAERSAPRRSRALGLSSGHALLQRRRRLARGGELRGRLRHRAPSAGVGAALTGVHVCMRGD